MEAVHVPALRVHTSLLASAEKRLLVMLAGRLPPSIRSDHLTAVGAAAMLGVGAAFGAGGTWRGALLLVIPLLVLNWFGDSLDGTVARVRHQERPRYGYYVDHVLDALGFVWLIGGLVLGGWMSLSFALAFLASYYLLVIEVSLAVHALGRFQMSFWRMGPTELRIVLALGTMALLYSPDIRIGSTPWLLFDAGGLVGAAGLLATFVAAALRNGIALYRQERV
jgi:archaetidylinositol phosphate synthase